MALGSPMGCSDAGGDGGGAITGDPSGDGTGGDGTGNGTGSTNGSGTPGDNGTGEGNFGITNVPNIELDPVDRQRFIIDTGMDVGSSQTHGVAVINTGSSALTVSDVRLQYILPEGADDGEHPAFELLNAPSETTQVYPQAGDEYPKGLDIQVSYTRKADNVARSATLIVESDDPDEPNVAVEFATQSGEPLLTTDKVFIDFPLLGAGAVGEEPINIFNTGTRTLMVSGFKITKDGRFGIRGDDWEIGGAPDAVLSIDLTEAIAVPPGGVHEMIVTFYSDSESPAEGNLLIYSDDPDTGVGGHVVALTANKNGPCIDVDPQKVNFGGKVVGTQNTIEVEIASCGTAPLLVYGIEIAGGSSPDFTLDLSALEALNGDEPLTANTPLEIPINQSVVVPVVFVPDQVNPKDPDKIPIPDQGVMNIASNAFQSLLEVELEGAGAEQDCPVPVIHVEEGDEVIPQTVLHLDGMQSYAPFGAITAWIWTVEQPDGSQEVFVPSATAPQPIFQANVVGLYTFTLEVMDENNNWSTGDCKPDVYKVLVQPDQAIHVELTWETPGDPDETDTGPVAGSDLDLHFAHPNASGPDLDQNGVEDPWFDKDWDAFWYNKAPNWGSFDPSAGDDPSLDRDDTDGAGPENLNMGIPEDDIVYHIGVHYWDSHGLGPVTTTVRVWTYATLIYEGCAGKTEEECCLDPTEGGAVCEVLEAPLNELDMWCVGAVNWPDPEVASCLPLAPDTVTPNYVNPFFLSF
ncbi:MAG: PKD domain-containing protein [Myxococcota bacterium]